MSKQGTISVETENIFPIIKKFLYSEQEIFLRELVSNATDACTKLKTLAEKGEVQGEIGELKIEISIDKEAKTLTVKDTGIGMSEEEVDKYINRIAFSGAKEFVEKFKNDSPAGIIGHFGLGFYSAFMVADNVEIITKSYTDAPAVKWICDGSTSFTLEETAERTERGTDIILHLNETGAEYLSEDKITGLLKKFCKFMPVPIWFNGQQVNAVEPIWTKKPADLSAEEYNTFYRELYPMTFQDPLFHIHLNVDYPFTLTGVLYFPKIDGRLELQKNKISLYSNRVFVTDSVEGIVPDFLMLLHGVLDSPDIPLNVSRSYLQGDPNVKKISNHITKKVADRLEEMFKNSRPELEEKWEDIKLFVAYGMLTDEKFAERAAKFLLFQSAGGEFKSWAEWQEALKPIQTDKNNKLVVLYTSDKDKEHSYIQRAKEKGYEVLILNTPLDAHLLQHLEGKFPEVKFARVDSDSIDKLIDKGEEQFSKLSEEETNTIKSVFEKVTDSQKFVLQCEVLSETDSPVIVTQNEFMRRMTEMNAVGGGGMSMFGNLPESYNLVLNTNHPLMGKILTESDENAREKVAKQAIDLALLGKNLLKGEELTGFIKRSLEMIG
ncbi:MAG: molecular chaperone HtpG [Flavobacteriales bacterium]|nr:molecular chaperone HtpG [Flavobacteriales bacterium]